jgi:hypothetical protein
MGETSAGCCWQVAATADLAHHLLAPGTLLGTRGAWQPFQHWIRRVCLLPIICCPARFLALFVNRHVTSRCRAQQLRCRYRCADLGHSCTGEAWPAVVLMNAMVPLIDRGFRPRVFGRSRRGASLEAKAQPKIHK